MPIEKRLLNRTISFQDSESYDEASSKLVDELVLKILKQWPGDTITILTKLNVDLLEKLSQVESQVESLLYITRKPPNIKRTFTKILAEYDKIGTMCAVYAKRHTAV